MVSGTMLTGHKSYPPYPLQKRVLPADKAAEWAWCDELPKAPRQDAPDGFVSAWRAVAGYGEMLARIDAGSNRYGLAPDMGAADGPHADAVRMYEAAVELDAWEIDLPDDWQPAPELDGALAAASIAQALRRMRRSPAALIANRAIMGIDRMAMTIGPTETAFERDASGRDRWFVKRDMWMLSGVNADGSERTVLESIEAPGLDKRRQPLPGAYRKPYLDPDPLDALIARAEHEIWHAALTALCGLLAGKLETIALAPPTWGVRPWLAGIGRIGRILPDLAGGQFSLRRPEKTG